jgi:hypothetical protein
MDLEVVAVQEVVQEIGCSFEETEKQYLNQKYT